MPPKIFITHSWNDIDFARRLANDLKTRQFEVWFDDTTLKAGHRMAEQINRGLVWCDVYIPIISRAALASNWCDEEINAAIHLTVESRNTKPLIISVLIQSCRDELKTRYPSLTARLYIDFTTDYDAALRELLAKGFDFQLADPPKPRVAAPPPPEIIVPPAPKIVTPPQRVTLPKTGTEMILIPAGEFIMGSDESDNEKPPHKIYLDAFYIARYPVTNAEYKKFVDAKKHRAPAHWQSGQIPRGKENHPAAQVTWDDANAYAQWAGARLPTEAEWEKAASWDEARKVKRRYPWGDKFDAKKCNSSESKIRDTTPVGEYSPGGDSEYGVGDLAGNVWEWCADWFDANYYKNSPARNPMGPGSGQWRVLRGGSWNYDQGYSRGAYRYGFTPDLWNNLIGFRFVVSSS